MAGPRQWWTMELNLVYHWSLAVFPRAVLGLVTFFVFIDDLDMEYHLVCPMGVI